MCFYHDCYADFWQQRYPKLRRPQQCHECFRTIPAGELAEYVTARFEGEFYADYYCGECEATRFRVHLMELKEGCKGAETWCPRGDLKEYCKEMEIERSTFNGGQIYLRKRRRETKRKPAKIA